MNTALLIATGPNKGTLTNVLYAINKRISATHQIEKLLIIDIEEVGGGGSGLSWEDILESGRLALQRDIEVRKRKLSGDLQSLIPRLLVDGAKEVGRDNVVVDITSGNKTASAILYATASFCRLNHIYYVSVSKRQQGFANLWEETEPEKLFTVINLAPLRDVQHLAALSHFDLIFYLDTFDRLDSEASDAVSAELREVTHHLRSSLRLFFELRDNLASMQALGTATEHLIGLIYQMVNAVDAGAKIDKLTALKSWSDQLRKDLSAKSGPDYSRQYPITHALDHSAELLRNWRNASKHTNPPTFSGQEVRTAVNLVISLLEAIVKLTNGSRTK
jgi:hypothetical protein